MQVYFRENLAFLRKKLNKTQSEIAAQVNKSQRIISNWERDNTEPNIEEIGILSNFFGVTSDELLFHRLEADNKYHPQKTSEADIAAPLPLKKITEIQETTISALRSSIEDKNEIITMLKSENERLTRELEKKV